MNARNLRLLVAAAVLIVAVAFWVGHSRAPQSAEQQPLYPGLKGKLDSVTGVSIFKAGDQLAAELLRDGAKWKVKQRHDYPGDAVKINNLLINLESAALREQKTSSPANYGTLAVQDLTDAATTGVRIELAGTAAPVKLIVGKQDAATRSTYVRRAGEAESWLVGTEIAASADPTQWLKREIVNVGSDRIQRVEVQLAGAPPYFSEKKARADANFDVTGLPKGRELNSNTAANSLAQALTSLQLDDVRPASELANEKNNDKEVDHAIFRTFDGLIFDCTGYKVGEQRWVVVKASFDGEQAKRFHVAAQAIGEAGNSTNKDTDKDKEKSAPDHSLENVQKKGQEEAAEIVARVDTWAYALPTFKYEAIFKPLEDMLKKVETKKK